MNGSAKIALVIGHNPVSPGAIHAVSGEPEYQFNSELAKEIAAFEYGDVRIFHGPETRSYSAWCRDVYAAVDEWGADLSIELHFNAATDTATGTETLSSGSRGSLIVAEAVHAEMLAALGLPDRGVKIRSTTRQRGGRALISGRAPAVIIEPFFGSNPSDCARFNQRRHMFAYCLARGALIAAGRLQA